MTLTSDGASSGDIGHLVKRLRFRGAVNTGYLLYCRVDDAGFSALKRVVGSAKPADLGYLEFGRKRIYKAEFDIKWGSDGTPPDSAMRKQTAYIISLHALGENADNAAFEFIAIDPPSYHLNAGDAAGKAYKDKKISDVIKQVVKDYAPGIQADVGETEDAKQNTWWMMRQDPKTFITSLLDWSSSLTKSKTQWMIGMDGTKIVIKPQGDLQSQNVALYRGPHLPKDGRSHLYYYELLADNALQAMNAKLVTQGISAISGQYLDKVSDKEEKKVFIKDSRTEKKIGPKTSKEQAFSQPPDDKPPKVGWTAIQAIPEVYSAGEIGKKYEEYIDGRARGLFLNMSNLIMRARFKVHGHGVFRDCLGLGVDTITMDWKDADGGPFFFSGNWIVYGFEHFYMPGTWYTDIHCSRIDFDAKAERKP